MELITASNRELALCYAHIAYRNTALEDYHSKNTIMDDTFYGIVYNIVAKQIRRIQRNQKLLVQIHQLEELQTMLQQMYYPRAVELRRFALDVLYNIHYKMGSEWDPAERLETDRPKDAADYILSGQFRECCEQHRYLDDMTMRYINRDVHNRMYTLVTMQYFGKNFES